MDNEILSPAGVCVLTGMDSKGEELVESASEAASSLVCEGSDMGVEMGSDSEETEATEDGPAGSTEVACRASSVLAETPWTTGETTGTPTEVTSETEGVEGVCAVIVSSPPRLSSLIRSQILATWGSTN